MIYRQGDVLIKTCKAVPANVTEVKAEDGRLIVARGEATGHHHSFPHRQGITLFRDDGIAGTMYLGADVEAPLEHQEHTTHALPPGCYEIVIQRLFSAGMVKPVID